jgi:phosphoglycolate phosphatase
MRAIFLDLDGTLIDSGYDLANSINYMLEKLDKKQFDIQTIKSWVGNGSVMLVKRALSGGFDIKDNIEFERGYEIFMKHYEENVCIDTKIYPNVLETLKKLKNNYKLVIITNKPHKFVNPILKTLKMDFFDFVLGAGILKEKKPHPKPILFCLDKLNLNKDEVIMVGDSKNDIISAKEAGVKSVAVSYGYNYNEDIARYKPDYVINDFKEIIDILD